MTETRKISARLPANLLDTIETSNQSLTSVLTTALEVFLARGLPLVDDERIEILEGKIAQLETTLQRWQHYIGVAQELEPLTELFRLDDWEESTEANVYINEAMAELKGTHFHPTRQEACRNGKWASVRWLADFIRDQDYRGIARRLYLVEQTTAIKAQLKNLRAKR